MIKCKFNPNGDTRTAKPVVTENEFKQANYSHVSDVNKVMSVIATQLIDRGLNHDSDKLDSRESSFFADFERARAGEINFTDGAWYQNHVVSSRHHLNSHVPEQVNLIDVIEMIVDVVTANVARSKGEDAINLSISDDILQQAVANTVQCVRSLLEVTDTDAFDEPVVEPEPEVAPVVEAPVEVPPVNYNPLRLS